MHHTSLYYLGWQEHTVAYGNKPNIAARLDPRPHTKILSSGFLTCSHDRRTIAGMLSSVQAVDSHIIYTAGFCQPRKTQVGVTCTFDPGANEVNVDAEIMYIGVSPQHHQWLAFGVQPLTVMLCTYQCIAPPTTPLAKSGDLIVFDPWIRDLRTIGGKTQSYDGGI